LRFDWEREKAGEELKRKVEVLGSQIWILSGSLELERSRFTAEIS
jgi:hypothetical protein